MTANAVVFPVSTRLASLFPHRSPSPVSWSASPLRSPTQQVALLGDPLAVAFDLGL